MKSMSHLLAPNPAASLIPLPEQPRNVPWPSTGGSASADDDTTDDDTTDDGWPTGTTPNGVDADRVEELLDEAFGPTPNPDFGESFAAVIVHGGRIVAERYGPGCGPSTPHLSWSMAKSITHALVGILVADGLLDPAASAQVPEWSDPSDPRHEITLDQLLRMVDGLDFCESYTLPDGVDTAAGDVPFSHCIDMLFGAGSDDHAGYAASRPLARRPGTTFNYSSGTANIVARMVCDLVSEAASSGDRNLPRAEAVGAWMRERLFDPIGMTSAQPSFDSAGNYVGSSYFHATARDYARFGLLYLRGGQWNGQQILPPTWIDYARSPRAIDDEGVRYGSHWWADDDNRGTFHASGYEWQRVMCVPLTDLIIVRLGKTLETNYETPVAWMNSLIAEFDPLRH